MGIVTDLGDGLIDSVGGKPGSDAPHKTTILSDENHVELKYKAIDVSNQNDRLSCANATAIEGGNARYIDFEDDWTTVAEIDSSHSILVSGDFSGCAYKLYRSADAEIFGAHIARPGGEDSDAQVDRTDTYAQDNDWEELLDLRTSGYVGGEVDAVWVVSELQNDAILTILLQIGKTGNIVGTTQIVRTAL